MRVKGNILLVLLIMLLFASAALLQLSEDNYLAHLISAHVGSLLSARKSLSKAAINFSAENQACYVDADAKADLETFWQSHQSLCQMNISGAKVMYAFRDYKEDKQEEGGVVYRQITLRTKNANEFEWLRVVKTRNVGVTVSWTYHFL